MQREAVPSASRPYLRPRDAATLVVFDTTNGQPQILMGRRRMDQVFLPGHYVFPGGRVDPQDKTVTPATPLHADHVANLMYGMGSRPSASRAKALALAAVRETFEETGLVVGEPLRNDAATTAACPPSWRLFLSSGMAPALGSVSYFARALTPPGRSRRYDTRFFAVPRRNITAQLGSGDGELEDVDWFALDTVRGLKLPSITRLVLEDFIQLIAPDIKRGMGRGPADARATGATQPPEIPFYFQRRGVFQRALLSRNERAP